MNGRGEEEAVEGMAEGPLDEPAAAWLDIVRPNRGAAGGRREFIACDRMGEEQQKSRTGVIIFESCEGKGDVSREGERLASVVMVGCQLRLPSSRRSSTRQKEPLLNLNR